MPLVLVRAVASRQLVVAASQEAESHGIRTDMTLAEARALCPGLIDAPHEPEKDLRALEGLARWMTRFTPIVSLGGTSCLGASVPPCLFLDVTGCERAFGGLPNLLEQVAESLRNLRLHAHLAVAPTPGAAWALAYAGPSGAVVLSQDQIRPSLTPLPVASLRIDDETRTMLNHLGIDTVGQLLTLPRHALPARFGPTLLTRIDQVLGRIPEPLTGIPYAPPIESRLDFDGVVDSLDTVWTAFEQLIDSIVADLTRRGQGARKLELHFFRSYAPTIIKTILLSRPSRDKKNLFNLVRCAMETLERSAGPSHARTSTRKSTRSRLARQSDDDGNAPAGFTGLRLRVPVFEQLADEQIHLLEQDDHDSRIELDHLLERLMLRLGEEAVLRPQLTESYVPERAWHGGSEHEPPRTDCPCPATITTRPLHLLDTPIEIPVMVSPSQDRDGRPVSFTLEGEHHRVAHCTGPERIGGQWWQGHFKTRDYFAVETESARRVWLFRVREANRWYVHGTFD